MNSQVTNKEIYTSFVSENINEAILKQIQDECPKYKPIINKEDFIKRLTEVSNYIAEKEYKHNEVSKRIRETAANFYSKVPCSVVDSLDKEEQNIFYWTMFLLMAARPISAEQKELMEKVAKIVGDKKCNIEDSVYHKLHTGYIENYKWFYGEDIKNN